jgi:hypothetical protein
MVPPQRLCTVTGADGEEWGGQTVVLGKAGSVGGGELREAAEISR